MIKLPITKIDFSHGRLNVDGVGSPFISFNNGNYYIVYKPEGDNKVYKLAKETFDAKYFKQLIQRLPEHEPAKPLGLIEMGGIISGYVQPYFEPIKTLQDYYEQDDICSFLKYYIQLLEIFSLYASNGLINSDFELSNYFIIDGENCINIDYSSIIVFDKKGKSIRKEDSCTFDGYYPIALSFYKSKLSKYLKDYGVDYDELISNCSDVTELIILIEKIKEELDQIL